VGATDPSRMSGAGCGFTVVPSSDATEGAREPVVGIAVARPAAAIAEPPSIAIFASEPTLRVFFGASRSGFLLSFGNSDISYTPSTAEI
jgi:hypothetical protein